MNVVLNYIGESRSFNNNDDEMFMTFESSRGNILYIASKFVELERTLNNETRNYDAERDLAGRKNLDTRFSYERLKRQKALSITWNASREIISEGTSETFIVSDFYRRKPCITFSIAEAKRVY